jgi:hypothetical protein
MICLCIGITQGYSQEQFPDDSLDAWEYLQIEKLLESAIDDEDNSSIDEELTLLEENPIDINSASKEEMQRIPYITSILASRIIERRKNVPFIDKDELKYIDGISPDLLSLIRKYIIIGQHKEMCIEGSYLSRMITTIEQMKGTKSGTYSGGQAKILNRIRLSCKNENKTNELYISNIETGMITEKDPGERSMTDFVAGFIEVSMQPFSTRLIAGNYQIEEAEGLMFGPAVAYSKGSEIIAPVRKNGPGIRPYLSSDENRYYQGLALSIEYKSIRTQMFYSDKKANATLDDDGNILSLDRSGLFRTADEMKKKNASRERLFGGRMELRPAEGLRIGGTGYYSVLDNPIMVNDRQNRVSDLWMTGMDISYNNANMDLFTEFSADIYSRLAGIIGFIYEPDTKMALTINYRNYPSDFVSIHGNAFGESTAQVENENGMYFGIKLNPLKNIFLTMYYDQFKHPANTFLLPTPSCGNDFLALAEIHLTRKFDISLRFKQKSISSTYYDRDYLDRTIKSVVPRLQQNYRLSFDFASSSSVRLINRIEWLKVCYHEKGPMEKGLLLSQSIRFKIFKFLNVRARITEFQTDSYDARIYEYEEDLPGAGSNRPLYGSGMRLYLIAGYNISKKLSFTAKYSQIVKEGVRSLGSGLAEITGSSQNTVGAQIEVRF